MFYLKTQAPYIRLDIGDFNCTRSDLPLKIILFSMDSDHDILD
jgi:hypothetical protein